MWSRHYKNGQHRRLRLKPRSQLLKCFYISTEEAHDPRELCKYDYDRQAKGESEPHGSHLILTLEQTNKQRLKPTLLCHQTASILSSFQCVVFVQSSIVRTRILVELWTCHVISHPNIYPVNLIQVDPSDCLVLKINPLKFRFMESLCHTAILK